MFIPFHSICGQVAVSASQEIKKKIFKIFSHFPHGSQSVVQSQHLPLHIKVFLNPIYGNTLASAITPFSHVGLTQTVLSHSSFRNNNPFF
jgi:hypothetical protein